MFTKDDIITNVQKMLVPVTRNEDVTICECFVDFAARSLIIEYDGKRFKSDASRLVFSLLKNRSRVELRKAEFRKFEILFLRNTINFDTKVIDTVIYFKHEGEKKSIDLTL